MKVLIMALSAADEVRINAIKMANPDVNTDEGAVSWALRQATGEALETTSTTDDVDEKLVVGEYEINLHQKPMPSDIGEMAPFSGVIKHVVDLDKCRAHGAMPIQASVFTSDHAMRNLLSNVLYTDDCVMFLRQ